MIHTLTRRKILGYFMIENAPGGNQDWLPEWDMNMGGCAAVPLTAERIPLTLSL